MDRNREKKFQIYVSVKEKEKIKEKAHYCGMDMSKYARKALLDGVIINISTFEYMEVMKELTKIADSIRKIEEAVYESGMDEGKIKSLKVEVDKLSTLYVEKMVNLNSGGQ